MSATWTTNDGRVLEIVWMDSQHLVNSVNMLIRKGNLRQDTFLDMKRPVSDGAKTMCAMREEIKLRELLIWDDAKAQPQLIRPDFRETLPQMCLTRAYIDTGRQWFGMEVPRDVFSCMRYQFEAALVDLENCIKRQWKGHERASVILAKFVEYRLAPPAQWR